MCPAVPRTSLSSSSCSSQSSRSPAEPVGSTRATRPGSGEETVVDSARSSSKRVRRILEQRRVLCSPTPTNRARQRRLRGAGGYCQPHGTARWLPRCSTRTWSTAGCKGRGDVSPGCRNVAPTGSAAHPMTPHLNSMSYQATSCASQLSPSRASGSRQHDSAEMLLGLLRKVFGGLFAQFCGLCMLTGLWDAVVRYRVGAVAMNFGRRASEVWSRCALSAL